MYCLTRVRQLFYFFFPTPSASIMWSQSIFPSLACLKSQDTWDRWKSKTGKETAVAEQRTRKWHKGKVLEKEKLQETEEQNELTSYS